MTEQRDGRQFEGIIERQKSRAAIVGAGVIGLTNAILAQEAGFQATIYSDLPPSNTTSTKAAAIFLPFSVPLTARVLQMAEQSWKYYNDLERSTSTEVTGIRKRAHWELDLKYQDAKDMPYLELFDNVEQIEDDPQKTPGNFPYGVKYTTFFMEMPVYIPYLIERFRQNGGLFVQKHFSNMDELADLQADVVFNCSGLGARSLAHDEKVSPLRGQVVFVGPQPQMLEQNISVSHGHNSYVIPQPITKRTILGGTLVEDWNDEIDPETSRTIIQENKRILPNVTARNIRGAAVGLRPYRKEDVRVEAEEINGKLIIHNYGHGGSGVTLAWGSAKLAMDQLK